MSDINGDDAFQSDKREDVYPILKFLIAALGTIVGWKCLTTQLSPLETDLGASALFIVAVFVFVASLRVRLIWNPSVWPDVMSDVAELAGLLAAVALVLILNRPLGWFAFGALAFWVLCITFRWLGNLHPNYVTNIQAMAENLVELVCLRATQEEEHSSVSV